VNFDCRASSADAPASRAAVSALNTSLDDRLCRPRFDSCATAHRAPAPGPSPQKGSRRELGLVFGCAVERPDKLFVRPLGIRGILGEIDVVAPGGETRQLRAGC